MEIKKLPDGKLLVPIRAEGIVEWKKVLWDAIIEIDEKNPEYQKYFDMYQHDLLVTMRKKKIFDQEEE